MWLSPPQPHAALAKGFYSFTKGPIVSILRPHQVVIRGLSPVDEEDHWSEARGDRLNLGENLGVYWDNSATLNVDHHECHPYCQCHDKHYHLKWLTWRSIKNSHFKYKNDHIYRSRWDMDIIRSIFYTSIRSKYNYILITLERTSGIWICSYGLYFTFNYHHSLSHNVHLIHSIHTIS